MLCGHKNARLINGAAAGVSAEGPRGQSAMWPFDCGHMPAPRPHAARGHAALYRLFCKDVPRWACTQRCKQ